MTRADKLDLMEKLVRSLRDEALPSDDDARRRALSALLDEVARMPARNPEDGFTSADVDRAIYEQSQ